MARNPNRTHTLTANLDRYGTWLYVECHNDPNDPDRDCRMQGEPGCAAASWIEAGGQDAVGVVTPARQVRLPATARVRWANHGEYPELVVEA